MEEVEVEAARVFLEEATTIFNDVYCLTLGNIIY
jgi:hypothetical protein